MQKANAVFEGGGVKGIGLIGALQAFEEVGFQWQNLAAVPPDQTTTPTATDRENHERMAISPAPTATNGHADMQNGVTLASLT